MRVLAMWVSMLSAWALYGAGDTKGAIEAIDKLADAWAIPDKTRTREEEEVQ